MVTTTGSLSSPQRFKNGQEIIDAVKSGALQGGKTKVVYCFEGCTAKRGVLKAATMDASQNRVHVEIQGVSENRERFTLPYPIEPMDRVSITILGLVSGVRKYCDQKTASSNNSVS